MPQDSQTIAQMYSKYFTFSVVRMLNAPQADDKGLRSPTFREDKFSKGH